MVNLTEEFYKLIESNQAIPDSLLVKLQGKIMELLKMKPLKYNMRNKQLLSILEYIKKNNDILCVLATGYGKTLIALLCALYEWIVHQMKSVFIGLYKSLTYEQFGDFSQVVPTIIDDGDHKTLSGDYETKEWVFACLTPEKFDGILLNPEKRDVLMADVGLLVSDEIHNLGEENRGHRMENYLIVSHILYPNLRYINLSATVGNPEEFADWLNAKLIKTNPEERPIPLIINILPYNEILYSWSDSIPDQRANFQRRIQILNGLINRHKDLTFLIFCTSKLRVIQVAKFLCHTDFDISLTDMVEEHHVAYHSTDLNKEERHYIETTLRAGEMINYCVATPTLCMPSDEMIYTDNAIVNISELKDRKVLTNDGKYNQVKETMKRSFDGDLIKIYSTGNLPSRMTPEHNVLITQKKIRYENHGKRKVWEFSDPIWIPASQVQINDYVLFPIIQTNIDTTFIQLKQLKNTQNQYGDTNHVHQASNRISDRVELSESLLELMGIFVAEGCTGKNGVVDFNIGSHEIDFKNFIINAIQSNFGLTPKIIYNDHNGCRIQICSKSIAQAFDEFFDRLAHNIKIPSFIVDLPKKRLIPFIRGYFKGDGSITKLSDNSTPYERCTTVSYTLAKQLFAILIKMGYMPSLRCQKRRSKSIIRNDEFIQNKYDQYNVIISGYSGRMFLKEIFGIDKKYDINREYNCNRFIDGYYAMRVKKIEKEHYIGDVYNIEVENNPNYVSSFVVHNSAGVNFPVDVVVMFDVEQYSESMGSEVINANRIQQSIGRAGRPGMSKCGYAYVITPDRLLEEIKDHVYNPTIVRSQLKPRLHEKVLQWIGSEIAHEVSDVIELCHYSYAKITDDEATKAILWLKTFGFITELEDGTLQITEIGKRTNQMYIMPETTVLWQIQIQNIIDIHNFKELYIRFASVPEYYKCVRITPDDAKVLNYGIRELGNQFPRTNAIVPLCFTCANSFKCPVKHSEQVQCMEYMCNIPMNIPDEVCKCFFLSFYNSLAEKYLPKKKNAQGIWEVKHLPISNGDRYNLRDHARIIKAASVIFNENREFSKAIKTVADMVATGSLRPELVDLCGLKQVGIKKAEKLYDSGIKTMEDFLASNPEQIAKALSTSVRVATLLLGKNGSYYGDLEQTESDEEEENE